MLRTNHGASLDAYGDVTRGERFMCRRLRHPLRVVHTPRTIGRFFFTFCCFALQACVFPLFFGKTRLLGFYIFFLYLIVVDDVGADFVSSFFFPFLIKPLDSFLLVDRMQLLLVHGRGCFVRSGFYPRLTHNLLRCCSQPRFPVLIHTGFRVSLRLLRFSCEQSPPC